MDIFISYRREDTSGYALALRREITRALPGAVVFLDVDSIDAGMRWRDEIRKRIDRCDLMLVIIGDEWLETRAKERKLERDEDTLRFEVEEGLKRSDRAGARMVIMPVLVEDARMPTARLLPESVRGLCEYNAHSIHDKTYDQDVGALIARLTKLSDDRDVAPRASRATITAPNVATSTTYPSKITDRYLRQEVVGMGRDQLLALIAELIGRGWSHDAVFDHVLSYSPLRPPARLPARITPVWLATNVPLLGPKRLEKLVKTLHDRQWSDEDIRTHVFGNRQAGLARPVPVRVSVAWIERNAPLMTATEQDDLAAALAEKRWDVDEILSWVPFARLPEWTTTNQSGRFR
jgi:hypothetical protein